MVGLGVVAPGQMAMLTGGTEWLRCIFAPLLLSLLRVGCVVVQRAMHRIAASMVGLGVVAPAQMAMLTGGQSTTQQHHNRETSRDTDSCSQGCACVQRRRDPLSRCIAL
jgi:hypothetical protein